MYSQGLCSVTALQNWIDYDLDKSINKKARLINSSLSRDYYNPLAKSEVKVLNLIFLNVWIFANSWRKSFT
ncbi:T6SS amidase immunity protein Tai4 family protein [Snodgrassella alvi]